jgi:hypothetical protein
MADPRADARRKLEQQLASLEDEQRVLDLRDPNALVAFQRRVEQLKREIERFRHADESHDVRRTPRKTG